MTFEMPDDVARVVFAHLNGDEGWRNEIATRLEVTAARRATSEADRRRVAELQKLVVSLGILSGSLARAGVPPSRKGGSR